MGPSDDSEELLSDITFSECQATDVGSVIEPVASAVPLESLLAEFKE